MGLLDLVEEDHGEWLLPHPREQPLAVIGAADQERGAVGPGKLRHVEADEPVGTAECEFREPAGKLRLPHAGRSHEEHHAGGPGRIDEPRLDHRHEIDDRIDRPCLAHEPTLEEPAHLRGRQRQGIVEQGTGGARELAQRRDHGRRGDRDVRRRRARRGPGSTGTAGFRG